MGRSKLPASTPPDDRPKSPTVITWQSDNRSLTGRRKMRTTIRNKVLLRGEQSDSAVSIVEHTMPAGAPGPPLHSHAFDEAFYVLDGELTFQLRNKQTTAKAGELAFAPRRVPHTLANLTDTPARFLLVITPAGFERELARRAAKEAGVEPPKWALEPIPEVNYLGPRIGEPH
jgi:quercetin dioxygenase-like cupin family protein